MLIGITLGDTGGIGPEVTFKAVYGIEWGLDQKFLIIGSKNAATEQARLLNMPVPPEWSPAMGEPTEQVSLWDVKVPGISAELCPGKMLAESGIAAVEWIRTGVSACLDGTLDAIVTSPICKKTFMEPAGGCPGHTEFIAELAGVKRPTMMLMGGGLRVFLVTTHLPLREVPAAITVDAVIETCTTAALALEWLGCKGRLALCALNPHGGENGALGKEEITVLKPAIAQLERMGFVVDGPIPADVVFYHALKGIYDGVVAMYHDQGLGPLKTVGFDTGVNLTLGLPLVRSSPDHGTAFDIAGKGVACPASMVSAIECAAFLSKRTNPWRPGDFNEQPDKT